jgi:RNA polymerase sigma-54 factor
VGVSGHSFSQRQVQGVRQEMLLLPRMLQAIEVLELSAAELDGFLARAAEENEALVLEPAPPAALPAPRGRASAEASDRHAAWLESQPAQDDGRLAALLAQVDLLELKAEDEAWVRLVVRALDENGYLSLDDEELLALAAAEGLGGGARELGRAIAAVQGLEPRGIGGRDMVEALLLQLDADDPDYALLCRLLEEFLEDLARNKLPRVSRALGIDLERLHELLGRLRGLEPAPGKGADGAASPPLVPDVIVRGGAEGFEVHVDRSGLPAVRIDEDVRALARDRTLSREVSGYLRAKVQRARWLVEALEERQRTLLRIARVLFERQGAWRGSSPRRPGGSTRCGTSSRPKREEPGRP